MAEDEARVRLVIVAVEDKASDDGVGVGGEGCAVGEQGVFENFVEASWLVGVGVLLGEVCIAELSDGFVGADEVDFGDGAHCECFQRVLAERVKGPIFFEPERTAAEAFRTEVLSCEGLPHEGGYTELGDGRI